jgi:hypothetical protein
MAGVWRCGGDASRISRIFYAGKNCWCDFLLSLAPQLAQEPEDRADQSSCKLNRNYTISVVAAFGRVEAADASLNCSRFFSSEQKFAIASYVRAFRFQLWRCLIGSH